MTTETKSWPQALKKKAAEILQYRQIPHGNLSHDQIIDLDDTKLLESGLKLQLIRFINTTVRHLASGRKNLK